MYAYEEGDITYVEGIPLEHMDRHISEFARCFGAARKSEKKGIIAVPGKHAKEINELFVSKEMDKKRA